MRGFVIGLGQVRGRRLGMRLWGLLLGFWGQVCAGLVYEGKVLITMLFFFLLEVSGTSEIVDQRRYQAVFRAVLRLFDRTYVNTSSGSHGSSTQGIFK